MTANSTEPLKPPRIAAPDAATLGNGGTWGHVDRLIEELATTAKADTPTRQTFYAQLLEGATHALAAQGGGIWQESAHGKLTPLAQLRCSETLQGPGFALRLSSADKFELAQILPPVACKDAREPGGPPLAGPLVVCRLRDQVGGATMIAVELVGQASTEVQRRSADLLNVFREVAVEFECQQELKSLRRREEGRQLLKEFELRIHDSLEPLPTAYALANDGRLWIGCDRLSVVEMVAGRAKLLAVSGVDSLDRGSAEVRGLQELAKAVAASGERLHWTEGTMPDLPPQIEQARETYIDLVPARRLIVQPLRWRGKANPSGQEQIRAILVAECYDERIPEEQFHERVSDVARHGGAALLAALTYYDLPLVPLQRKLAHVLGVVRQRKGALLAGLILLAAIGVLLAVVPARFNVEARGTLEPAVRRHLFAPSDGIVERVLAAHGQQVAQNAPLLVLHDPRLDLDYSRVGGELQTARAKLDSVQASRSRRSSAADVREEDRQLAAEEEQLREQVRGLESQLRLFSELRERLHISSPIDGTVLTWNPENLLRDRPVKQGQLLMSVADTSGGWLLELKLPDSDVGHVLSAQRKAAAALPVTYLVATDPAATHRGNLERVALATTQSDGDTPAARATVRLAGVAPRDARAGAGVIARIDCGTRSIGYVWLHDLIDFARTQLLF